MMDSFDELMKSPQERRAMTLAVIFLGAGFGALWLLQNVLQIKAESVAIAMLLLPLIVYFIVSGRISELKTPGGLEAKFREFALSSVSAQSEKIQVEDVQVPEEGQISYKSIITVKKPDPRKPLVLLLTLGAGENHYSRAGLLVAMDTYAEHRNFKFVVFQDKAGKFIGYMMSWAFRSLLEKEALGNEFVVMLNSGDQAQVLQYPNVVQETVTTEDNNLDCLKAMTEKNIEALVVINKDGKLEGVVEREQVLSKLMLSLAS